MLTFIECTVDLSMNRFITIIKSDNINKLTAEGEGVTVTAEKIGDIFKLELNIDVFNNKSVVLKCDDRVFMRSYHLTTLVSSYVDYADIVLRNATILNFTYSSEAYSMGGLSIIADNYDRGLNDGLILGQMI